MTEREKVCGKLGHKIFGSHNWQVWSTGCEEDTAFSNERTHAQREHREKSQPRNEGTSTNTDLELQQTQIWTNHEQWPRCMESG